MSMPRVVPATPNDHARLRHTMTLAFAADPVNRWYLADAERYLTFFPKVVDLFLTPSIHNGTCLMTSDGGGAALWLPPGQGPDEEAATELFSHATEAHLSDELAEFMAGIESYHPHDPDCWYLPLIGVDPAFQGRGLGGALMKYANQIIDQKSALGYLEASSEKNAALYARYGFAVMGEVKTATSPIARPMLRPRQS